jgi:hypothetical protein
MLLEKIFNESIRLVDTWPNMGVDCDSLFSIFPSSGERNGTKHRGPWPPASCEDRQ